MQRIQFIVMICNDPEEDHGNDYYHDKPETHWDGIITFRENADTEANARAKMLIYLLENKLLNF